MPSPPSFDRSARRAPPRPARRWLWVVAVSIVVHLLLLDALPRFTVAPPADQPVLLPLHARLMPPVSAASPGPEPIVAPSPAPRQTTRPRPPKPATPVAKPRPPESVETFVPESYSPVPRVEAQQATVEPAASGMAATGPAASPPAAAQAPTTPVAEPAPAVATPPATVTPPLSARIEYKVVSQNVKEANPIYGNGTITWSTADGRYRVALDVSAKALFFDIGLLAAHSDGGIDAAGLAPDRYTEKTGRRALLAANFNRDERRSVTFSASPASVPLAAGAQDRLSILFQIGGLLLADRSRAAAGARVEVPVANVRNDVEHWSFASFGAETIDSGVGPVATIHLQRTPKPGSNDRTLDLWVADDGGYPAQVRYTEPNGSTITMTLDRIGAVE